MRLTGNEIIEMIDRYGLREVECSFSLPNDIYQQHHRQRVFRKLTPEELYDIYDRFYAGEKLSELAKEYGANPSYLSSYTAKKLVQQENIRRVSRAKRQAGN